uniref:hypothetical protein n=1 Tax=Parerythrobacter lutipelagi TaxID=1964208 RepID=UPI0010F4DDC8|nr:hypothetical protein [Parerythrobacter lutipelagi]
MMRIAAFALALLATSSLSVANEAGNDFGEREEGRWHVYAGGYSGWSAMDVGSIERDGDLVYFRSFGVNRSGPVNVDGLSADFYILDRVYDCAAKLQWSRNVRYYRFDGTQIHAKVLEAKPRPLTGSEAVHFSPMACGDETPRGGTSLNLLIRTGKEWHEAASAAAD